MAKNKEITGIIVGELTEELKIKYNKQLAIVLMAEYGKESCEKILEGLKEADTKDCSDIE